MDSWLSLSQKLEIFVGGLSIDAEMKASLALWVKKLSQEELARALNQLDELNRDLPWVLEKLKKITSKSNQ